MMTIGDVSVLIPSTYPSAATGHGSQEGSVHQKAHAAWATLAFSWWASPCSSIWSRLLRILLLRPPPPPVVQPKAAPVALYRDRRGACVGGAPTGGRSLRTARLHHQTRDVYTITAKTLPAQTRKLAMSSILVSKYQVMLIEGGTGCGKTTQVPQFC